MEDTSSSGPPDSGIGLGSRGFSVGLALGEESQKRVRRGGSLPLLLVTSP